MAVITISKEFGSSGKEIAEKTAATLGFPLADKETIGTLLNQYGLIEFNWVYNTIPAFWESFESQNGADRTVVIDMMNRVIQALARRGNIVILGRGSYVVLAGLSDVLHVRIRAPFDIRVSNVMEWQKLNDRSRAEAIVRENDKFRTQFIKSVYGEPGERPESFDIVINTGKVAPELAASWVITAARALDTKVFAPETRWSTNTMRCTADLPEDSILAETVAEVLHAA